MTHVRQVLHRLGRRVAGVTLRWTGGSSTFYARSGSDTTLIVNMPNGDWRCDGDSHGNALVIIETTLSGL